MAKSERRLVPIVSIDVVGFSRLVQHNERQTVRLVRRAYAHFVNRIGERCSPATGGCTPAGSPLAPRQGSTPDRESPARRSSR